MNPSNRIKWAAGIASLCLEKFLPTTCPDSLGILVYHRITPMYRGVEEPTWNVTPDQFQRQLTELSDRGFRFISLQQALRYHESEEQIPERSVVVTFDDGYENVYLNAWPALRELSVPATVFLNTAFLGSDEPFHFDPWAIANQSNVPTESYRPLSIEQCREMQESGLIELGAHTDTHQDFRGRVDDFRADLQANLDCLRSEFSVDKASFAFPYGRVSLGFAGGDLAKAARQVGVTCSLTTECEVNPVHRDPFDWGRFNVYDWDTGATLEAKLNGWYGWMPKLQDFVTRTLRGRG